jgi:hypothetical protein
MRRDVGTYLGAHRPVQIEQQPLRVPVAYDDCSWGAFPTASSGMLTARSWSCAKRSDQEKR